MWLAEFTRGEQNDKFVSLLDVQANSKYSGKHERAYNCCIYCYNSRHSDICGWKLKTYSASVPLPSLQDHKSTDDLLPKLRLWIVYS